MNSIVLDPGHGGTRKVNGSSPNNATGPSGLKEKEVTLKVAQAAQARLNAQGFEVILTRREDRNVGIPERAAVAREADAKAFVSIHFNAPADDGPPAQGTETWIGEGHSQISKRLAATVQRHILGITQHRDRGVKVGNVSGVIKAAAHDADTANCLVEMSFLSRAPDEEDRLRQQDYIDALGGALAAALQEHMAQRGFGRALDVAERAVEAEDAASARRLGLIQDEEELVVTVEAGLSSEAMDEEAFGVPFDVLDAFERVTEQAPDVDILDLGLPAMMSVAQPVRIEFGPNAKEADVTLLSRGILTEVMQRAGLNRVTVSSTSRSPRDQARVMFNNIERFGVDHQKSLYGPAGDQVIEIYRRSKGQGLSASEIKSRMEAEILLIGPTRVSRHASDPRILNVFDVAPSSVGNRRAFEREIRAEERIAKSIFPPDDPGYHLEIPQT